MKRISIAIGLVIFAVLSVAALAGNTSLWNPDRGSILFPFTAPLRDGTAGTIDNMTIGATTPRAGSFTTLDATGAYTPTGGVAAAGGFTLHPYNIRTWQAIAATSGTDTACTNGTAYVGSIQIPGNMTITGISYLVGSVGGTDKVIVSLHDSTGAVVAASAAAGVTVGTAAQVQAVAFTAPVAVTGPATYFIALTFNGTTAKFRSVPAYTQGGVIGNGVTQTFGTTAAFTPPTTFTADKVPVAFVY